MHLASGNYTFITFKKRAHFLKIQATDTKFITPRVIIGAMPVAVLGITPRINEIYCGFTVTKTVGNAAERNLVKRRLRQLLPMAIAAHGTRQAAYVIIARKTALHADYTALAQDIQRGIKYICSKNSFLA